MIPGSLVGIFSHGWVWLLVILGPLLFFNQRLQLELQAALFAIPRSQPVTLTVFAILLFPGVFLHELSHWLAARLLGIRTGRFSLTPQVLPGNTLRLGFVEMAASDVPREALVGAAPLFAGGLAVAWISLRQLQAAALTEALASGQLGVFFSRLQALPSQPDFWIWFYLVFAISGTMFPSASDRRAWLPVAIAVLALVGLVALSGAGAWAIEYAGPLVDAACASAATILGVCLAVQIALLAPLWLLRSIFGR